VCVATIVQQKQLAHLPLRTPCILVCRILLCPVPDVQATLPQQLPDTDWQDLLLIAVNLKNPVPALHILSHVRRCKQLLYTSSSSSSDTVQLVEHLITTAIARGHWAMALVLAATPAAQQLGLQAVTQLLCLCIQLERLPAPPPVQQPWDGGYESDDDFYVGYYQAEELDRQDRPAPCFDALCALPAAQNISTSTIASLLRLAVKQKQYERGCRLCELPAAQQLPSQQLCELLLQLLLLQLLLPRQEELRARQRGQLVVVLIRLQPAEELAPGAAMQLLSTLIQKDSCRARSGVYGVEAAHELGVLAAVGSQLSGEEVLQLLQQAAEQGHSDAMRHMLDLAPARDIDNADGFAAFLRAALAATDHNGWAVAVQQLPVMQQLRADAVLGLVQACIHAYSCSSGSRPSTFMFNMLNHPAVSSFSTASLEQLLLEAAQQERLAAVAALLEAPAAAGLSANTVADLLQHAVRELHCDSDTLHQEFASEAMQPLLLSLPAAQQLSRDAVAGILSAAVAAQNSSSISRLCELPSAQQLSAEAAAGLLQEAAQQGYAVWNAVCSGLPQLGKQQPIGKQLLVFLQGAVSAADSRGLTELCQSAGEAEAEGAGLCGISAEDMLGLLSAALRKSALNLERLPIEAVAQLFQLGSARALGPDAVEELMVTCVGKADVSGLKLAGELPAAAQLDQKSAEWLVLRTLQEYQQKYDCFGYVATMKGCTASARETLLRTLLQQPAVQRLAPDAVARLLAACIEEELPQPLLLLRSELTAARQGDLDQDAVRQLLQAAFEAQQWFMFDWLVGLPAAPVHDDDEEVAMWRAVRACQSAQ
jgi:hypothetical protein